MVDDGTYKNFARQLAVDSNISHLSKAVVFGYLESGLDTAIHGVVADVAYRFEV